MIYSWLADSSLVIEFPDGRKHHYSMEELKRVRKFLNSPESLQKFRPFKDWAACPLERHPDDCQCGGDDP